MRRLAGVCCLCVVAAGCGQAAYDRAGATASAPAEAAFADLSDAKGATVLRAVAFAGQAQAQEPAAGESPIKPRIIYSAEVRVVAEDFATVEGTLTKLVEQAGGYLASAREDRSNGSSRNGSWTVRVPVGKFESFLTALDGIGFVESRSQTSEDVTAEFVDVEARIANLKRLEERFVKLLAEQTGKLEDVLKVEQELARTRGEIEQAEGRLRYLSNKTDFSTVTVSVREQRNYVPPQAPTFGSRIGAAWSDSLQALQRAGEGALIAMVALAPWLAVMALPVLTVVFTIRLAVRRKGRAVAGRA